MKAYYLLAPIAAIALAGCTVTRPVAYQPVVTAPTVAVVPSSTTIVYADWPTATPQGEGLSLRR